jgi:hypothetical protein
MAAEARDENWYVETKKKIREAFQLFDKDRKGCVIQEEVSTIMRYLGAYPTERAMVKEILPDMMVRGPASSGWCFALMGRAGVAGRRAPFVAPVRRLAARRARRVRRFDSEAFHTRLRVAGDDSIGAGNHESIGAASDASELGLGCLEERAHCFEIAWLLEQRAG